METLGGGREKPWTPPFCTVVAVDSSNFSYLACSLCDRPLPEDTLGPPPSCRFCTHRAGASGSKRLYRVLISIATADKVMVVVCFDRAARVLFGCSADELFGFCRAHPLAAEKAGEVLEGEMCQMTLCRPKNGNAQHLRAVSVVPLRTGFCPVIEELRNVFGSGLPRPVHEGVKSWKLNWNAGTCSKPFSNGFLSSPSVWCSLIFLLCMAATCCTSVPGLEEVETQQDLMENQASTWALMMCGSNEICGRRCLPRDPMEDWTRAPAGSLTIRVSDGGKGRRWTR